MSNENLSTLLGRNFNQTNYESVNVDLPEYPHNTQNLIATMIKDSPQSLTISKKNNSVVIEKNKNGFSDTIIMTRPFSLDFYKEIEQIMTGNSNYSVEWNEDSIRLTSQSLNLHDSDQATLTIEDAFRKASGIIHAIHSKSTNSSLIDFIVDKFDEMGSRSVKVLLKGSEAIIRLCDEVDIQVPMAELIYNLQVIESKRVVLHVIYCTQVDTIAKELSELGYLLLIVKSGQTSIHEYSRLRIEHSSESINSNLIGVIGMQSVPTINFNKVKKVKFIETDLYNYYKKFDSSPTSKEEIGIYGHTSYIDEIITGTADLIDYIPVPENIVEQQSVKMSAYDIYVMFKSKGYIFNLDKALSLSRRKLLTIDLIDIFIKRF